MDTVLIVAPHPDDETLGCGGTILRHRSLGDNVNWLVVTRLQDFRETRNDIDTQQKEILQVAEAYGFGSVTHLNFEASKLDTAPMSELVFSIKKVIDGIQPTIIYVPYWNDVHSDHRCVFDATISASKWFRSPSIKEIYAYETLSETNFAGHGGGFRPNVYINIEQFFEKKVDILRIYESQIAAHPFPRGVETVEALSKIRGSESGVGHAEAFILIKKIDRT